MSFESHSINSFGSTVTFWKIFLQVFQKGKGYRRNAYKPIFQLHYKGVNILLKTWSVLGCIKPKEISTCMLPARLNCLTEVMSCGLWGSIFRAHYADIYLLHAVLEWFTYHSLFFSESEGMKTTKTLFLSEVGSDFGIICTRDFGNICYLLLEVYFSLDSNIG